MLRKLFFMYGLLAYGVSLGTFLYAVGFLGNFLVPTTIDGEPRLPLGQALAIDGSLLALFALQHSGMARRGFKRWLTRFLPACIERSTYVLASSLALILVFALWEPMGGRLWRLEAFGPRVAIYAAYAAGWLVVLTVTFLIHHSDLFGLRQVWLQLHGRAYRPLRFVTPGPYRLVRHPLYVGWLIVLWATPTMTAAHLFFAVVTTGYILVGIRLEERDLLRIHGRAYARYRREVPMLVPLAGRSPDRRAEAVRANP